MVIVGHSQGGLLAKLTVVDSGTLFWDNLSDEPFDQVDGFVAVPTGPGLGIEIDEDAVRRLAS